MWTISRLGLLVCVVFSGYALADGRPAVPSDYPSHSRIGECYQQSVRRKLQDYNLARLDLAPILRHFADEQPMSPEAQHRLRGFAANLEDMRSHLPEPDPDSSAFRNFDFHLGLTFTSMTLFLNTKDERLTRRFTADRDNPNSELGQYLARLDVSRQQYMDGLEAARNGDCRT